MATDNTASIIEIEVTKKEIAFIDTSVSGYQTILEGMKAGVEVVLIDGEHDGLAQMAAALAGRTDVDAVHVFAHGAAGALQLGTAHLTIANIDDYAGELAAVRAAMGPQGDLMIYGCDVAQGDIGMAFVGALAAATGADVAASDDATGSALLGGNWVLEAQTGAVESQVALTAAGMAAYSGTLAIGDENFDGLGLIDAPGSTSMTAGNWRFTTNAVADLAVADASEFAAWLNNDGGAGDRAVILNYNGYAGITTYTMGSADGTNFKLESFKIGQSGPASASVTISAYSNGALVVAGESVNLASSDSVGNITYSMTADDVNGRYGTVTFNSAYANIDEIRFVFSGLTDLHLDDIDVSLADTTPPAFASAAVNGATLVMTYTDASMLDPTQVPAAGSFAVTAGGSAVTVNGVAVNAAAKTVTLTLASAVGFGQAVTVAYTDPTGGNDANAIQDAAGNDAATLGATAVTNNTPDTTPPVFASAAVNGTTLVLTYTDATMLDAAHPPAAFFFDVAADGSGLGVNSVTVNAAAKTVTLTLSTPVGYGQAVTVAYNDPTGGNDANAIQDTSGNDAATLAATSVTNNTPDTTPPTVSGNIAVPANGAYHAGQTLDFTVTFDENVTVTGTDSALALVVGASARSADYLSKTGNSITYRYTVQVGDSDANGITVGNLSLGTSTIRDAAGNNANLTLAGHVPGTSGILVDTTAPAVAGNIGVPANGAYHAGQNLDFTVTFDENVTVTGSDSTLGLTVGAAARSASFLSSTGNTVTYRYTVQAGDLDADGIAVGAIALGTSTIKDAAGNNASMALAGHVPGTSGVLVDTIAPAVSGNIAVPADSTYVAGQVLSFTVTFDENVTVAGTDSTLGLTVGATARNAVFASSTGNSVTYTYTVQAGDNDANGITVGAISLGTSTIRDAAGNNAATSLAGHLPATTGVLVDTGAPAVSGNIAVPANGAYHAGQTLDFTVTLDENVTVTGTDSTLALTIGSTARSADFLSKTGNSITYRYIVQAGDNDANGIAVGAVSLGNSTIKDAAGNDANLSLAAHVPSTAGVLVDTVAPSVAGNLTVPANGQYLAGQNLDFTVTFDENVTVTGSDSTLGLTVGAAARSASFVSSTGNSVTYRYTVQAGDLDADGIAVGAISLGTSTVKDAAGNDASVALAGHVLSTAGVLVDAIVPTVSGNIGVPANATYVAGQVLSFTVTFDENVTVTGSDSTLGLTVGATARNAVFASSSGNSVTYTYTVQAGDNDGDGIAVGAISLGTSTIRDASGNNAATSLVGHLPATTGVLVDTGAPAVSGSIAVPANGAYHAGQTLDFTVTFDENVAITGTDSALALTIGSTARSADYLSKTANSITYRYIVQAGDNDANGITVGAVSLGTSTIKDAAGNDANLTLAGHVPSTAGVLVDSVAPAVAGNLTVPANGQYLAGQNLDFTVTFDENVTVTGSDSTLGLTVGAAARSASFVSSSGNTVTYRYNVQAGDLDADGIAVGAISLGTSTIKDAAGNDASVSLTGHVPSTAGVLVDAIVPTVSGNIGVPANATYVAGQVLSFTVTFDENVTVTGSDSTLGLTVGATTRNAVFASSSGNSVTYTYTVQAGDNDGDGIAVGAISLGTSTIRDASGNNAATSLVGHLPATTGVLVDTGAPAVSGNIAVPANGAYHAGQTLDFTVTLDENVTVTGTDSTLALTIGSTARSADFLSKTGNSITYRYTVQVGDNDANGIAVGAVSLGTSTIRDAAGNNANLTLAGHLPGTSGILVDTTAPAVAGNIGVPANGAYHAGQDLDFTVTFDENITVTGSDSTLGLTVGAGARSASFLSSTGNSVTYRYTVQAGDLDADGIAVGSLSLGTSTVKDAAGNDASATLAGHVPSTAGVLVDAIAPAVSGNIAVPANATYVAGQVLTFTVTFDENVTVTGTDSTLGLTVGSTARSAVFASSSGNSVTYTYTVQAGDNDADGIAVGALALGTSTIRDAAGNNVATSLAGHVPATTGLLVDTAAPAYLAATVNEATLVLTYSDAAPLDAAHAPGAGAFTVMAGGAAVAVTAVAVNAAAHTVTLTLAAPVANGQAVTVAYADPTGGNDANAIQDAAGNDASTLAATAVVNNTPAPVVEPPVQTSTVDGVVLQTTSVVNSDGSTSQVLTIPVVTPSRVDSVGHNAVADIPLVTTAAGVILTAQVPTGLGLQASGPAVPRTAGTALTDLIREIKAHTDAGSHDQDQLTGGGSGFLGGMSADTPLLVQTIVPTAAPGGSAATDTLVITGTSAGTGNPNTALVIDTRALPGTPAIELHDVGFAALIGAMHVTGGTGSQTVWGDGAAQYIVLGADDDILHGGAGNDTVGSAGGNDQIFGDEGNDLVFGGSGNDTIDGGTGSDVLLLAGASRADYSLRVANGKLVMTHLHGGSDGVDVVANVETLRFSNATADTSAYGTTMRLVEALTGAHAELATVDAMVSAAQKGATLPQIAQAVYGLGGGATTASGNDAFVKTLYQNVFHRDVDAGGLAYWSGKLQAGASRADVTLALANSQEKLAMQPADADFNASDVATLVRMYSALFDRKADTAGLNYWIGAHEAGMSMADIADAFVAGAEASNRYVPIDDAQFVSTLYQSALHRQGQAGELQYWIGELKSGHLDRGDVLLSFADSAEKIALIGNITTSIDTL